MKILTLAACAALLLVGCQSEDSEELKELHIGLGPREAPARADDWAAQPARFSGPVTTFSETLLAQLAGMAPIGEGKCS